jgi:hypothetical protein
MRQLDGSVSAKLAEQHFPAMFVESRIGRRDKGQQRRESFGV